MLCNRSNSNDKLPKCKEIYRNVSPIMIPDSQWWNGSRFALKARYPGFKSQSGWKFFSWSINCRIYLDQIINWRKTHNLCLGKFTLSDLKRKIWTWTGIRTLDLRISSPASGQQMADSVMTTMPCWSDIHLKREIWTWARMRTRIAQVVERRARDPEVWGLNPSSGSNFSLEIW